MKQRTLNRRDFIKTMGLGTAFLATSKYLNASEVTSEEVILKVSDNDNKPINVRLGVKPVFGQRIPLTAHEGPCRHTSPVGWDRNTEMDLAGYNVYVEGSSTPLNGDTLITRGTEYFHMTGGVGVTYYVEAVNIAELASPQASAVSVLAPATIYDADNPGWSYLGQWAREDYSDPVLYGGSVLQVAHDNGATASVDFNGRRIKVFCSRYWQGGQVRFWVDGVDYGVVNLYKVEPLPARDIEWGYEALVITGLDKGDHTLTLEVLGAGCPEPPPPEYPTLQYNFANFEYAESR